MRLFFIVLIMCLLVGCESEDPETTPIPPTLEPTAQAQAIDTAIARQLTATSDAQVIIAPTQTIESAIRTTSTAVGVMTATSASAATQDANRAQTAAYSNLTLTAQNPTAMKQTVDASVRQRFTSTAQSQHQIDLNRTVDAAVIMTSVARRTLTPEP